MILGVGVDLVSLEKFRSILARPSADRFLHRVFSGSEIAYCRKSAEPAQAFGARFAAKEAVAKAFGLGFCAELPPLSIVVTRGPRGGPKIDLRDSALQLAEDQRVSAIYLSLSHTSDNACAFVILECTNEMRPPVTSRRPRRL